MLDRIKDIRRIAMAGAVIALLVPFTVEKDMTVQAQEACAGGICCTELMSACDGMVGYRSLCGSRGG